MSDRLIERIELLRGELIRNPAIAAFQFLQDTVAEGIGFFRVLATLVNGDFLQLVERFEYDSDGLCFGKYSFHWQRADGTLVCRWDNAPHHPELSTFPHHLHDLDEANILPHAPIDVFDVLSIIEQRLDNDQWKPSAE